jgi:hypothetical protein
MSVRRVISITALLAALAGATVLLQARITAIKPASFLQERMTYLPRSELMKPLLLGFSSTYADFLWIRTNLYFGGHYLTDHDYHYLVHMVDMVTKLNPHYSPAYEFAGLIIPDLCRDPDAARTILERGIGEFGPRAWNLPFYLGWIYFKNYRDPETAGRYLALAAQSPDVPPYIAGLAATMFRSAGKPGLGRDYLIALYQTTRNPGVRKVIEEKLRALAARDSASQEQSWN